jgi:hypothetical protein
MPELTRRRSEDRQDCWHIYYGDVHAGTIAMRVGNPHDTDQWEWTCGFYPGSKPGEIQSTRPRHSTMPALISRARGRSFYRTAPTLIFRRGAISGIGPHGNMRFGMRASGLSHQATDRASPRTVSGTAPAAKYSTCTVPPRYWCTSRILRRRKRFAGTHEAGARFNDAIHL